MCKTSLVFSAAWGAGIVEYSMIEGYGTLNPKRSCSRLQYGSFRKLGVPYFGVLIIRILLLRVLY